MSEGDKHFRFLLKREIFEQRMKSLNQIIQNKLYRAGLDLACKHLDRMDVTNGSKHTSKHTLNTHYIRYLVTFMIGAPRSKVASMTLGTCLQISD